MFITIINILNQLSSHVFKVADMQLFLVLTNILAEYTLSLPKGDKGELGTQFKV